jgi:hypothetical protein
MPPNLEDMLTSLDKINSLWIITSILTCGKVWPQVTMPDQPMFHLLITNLCLLMELTTFHCTEDLTLLSSSPHNHGFLLLILFWISLDSIVDQTMVHYIVKLFLHKDQHLDNSSLNPQTTGVIPGLLQTICSHRTLMTKLTIMDQSYKEYKRRHYIVQIKNLGQSRYSELSHQYQRISISSTLPL